MDDDDEEEDDDDDDDDEEVDPLLAKAFALDQARYRWVGPLEG